MINTNTSNSLDSILFILLFTYKKFDVRRRGVSTTMEHRYLGNRGYVIPKSSISLREIDEIKNELAVSAFVPEGYGQKPAEFKNYLESPNKLYLPKYYGLKRFGVPDENKISRGDDIDIEFLGKLRPMQERAVKSVLNACYDPNKMGGILCLQCGEGKTISAISMICTLKKKTLVIVHKEFLLQQWADRIREFSPFAKIGYIRAKIIDIENKDIVIAMLQSLSLKEYDPKIFESFGSICIDEVHHTSAEKFSRALRKVTFQYSIGLTATPNRVDGLTKVFMWFLGDIAYASKPREDFLRVVIKNYEDDDSKYNKEVLLYNNKANISRMINNICEHVPRMHFAIDEIISILKNEPERRLLMLSDRRSHLEAMKLMLDGHNIEAGFYYGGLKEYQLRESEKKQIILSTFSYASEGLDIKGLDTLVLSSPKSKITQICGRILRDQPEDRKHVPMIVDIVDDFSVFSNMAKKRLAYFKKCKYEITS